MSDYPDEAFLTSCYLDHIDRFTGVTDEDRAAARRAFNAVKAAAWDEGYAVGLTDHDCDATNPYREETHE